MGIFLKPEIIIFKESNSAEEHLAKLEELLPRATGKVKENIQKEIILTKAGIDGEKKVLYELKNSNMDLVVLQDICIRAKDGREAQIDFVIVTSKLMILLECKNLVGNIEIDFERKFYPDNTIRKTLLERRHLFSDYSERASYGMLKPLLQNQWLESKRS